MASLVGADVASFSNLSFQLIYNVCTRLALVCGFMMPSYLSVIYWSCFFFSKYLGLCMWLPAFLAKPADPTQEYANL